MFDIPFNRPHFTAVERSIQAVLKSGHTAGGGPASRACEAWAQQHFGCARALLTHSCTAALEMCAILTEVGPGDEVIMPSYTFVSTANAFALRGATIRLADSLPTHPNVDVDSIAALITSNTRAIVVVHYAGVACDMERIAALARAHGIWLIEDAAQALGAWHGNRRLGSIGHLATVSFHETKNIGCGEGGMLLVNDPNFVERAEIVHQKGTNRNAFARREAAFYTWVDIGSSFVPSDITAAILRAQLDTLDYVTAKRRALCDLYRVCLTPLAADGVFAIPINPPYSHDNGHIFYLVCFDLAQRERLIAALASARIQAVFHYVPLHESPFFRSHGTSPMLPNAERFGRQLLRLPLFYSLDPSDVERICHVVAGHAWVRPQHDSIAVHA